MNDIVNKALIMAEQPIIDCSCVAALAPSCLNPTLDLDGTFLLVNVTFSSFFCIIVFQYSEVTWVEGIIEIS